MTYLPVDVIVDQKGKQRHRIDTLNLLAYVVLLVLVLVTTWYFKRRKRLYIHETGLAIIYGMIMGAALRYFGLEVTISSVLLEDLLPLSVPADYVILKARNLGDKNANQTHVYAYEFRGELQSSAKLGSQISYASVDPEVFFNIILPPIVLNAGLSLKRRHFFRNIGAIFSYAFLGTTVSVAFVGTFIYGAIHMMKMFLGSSYLADQFSLANCLYFGAIISPTDPLAVLAIFQELGVDVNLFALVFGESILNDAVSIVLTHSIDQFSVIYGRNPYYPILSIVWKCIYNFINMFFTSCVIGILFGIISALTTKFTKLTETPLLETSLVVLMSYSSFLVAEVIDASGIVAVLLCGITQAHYTINNLSFEARERLKNLFELLTFLCENFLFLAVGVSFWQRGQTWDISFIGISFVAVIIARAISVYPLTAILNLGRRNKISCKYQHIITWGGAARGVISYSLAARNTVGDARRIMLSTTSVIVIFSVIVVGGSVEFMLRSLGIPFNGSADDRQQEYSRQAISSNNPGWLVRPKRMHRSNSDVTSLIHTPSACSRFNRHQNQASVNTTPILEVDTIWNNQQACRRHQYQSNPIQPGCTAACLQDDIGSQSSLATTTQQEQHKPILSEAQIETNLKKDPESSAAEIEPNRRQSVDQTLSLEAGKSSNVIDCFPASMGVISPSTTSSTDRPYQNASLVRRWRNLDNNFIKPLLTNSYPTLMETLPPSLRGLARLFTSDEQLMRQSRN